VIAGESEFTATRVEGLVCPRVKHGESKGWS